MLSVQEKNRRYREKNKDKIKEYNKLYSKINKKKLNEKSKKWNEDNKERKSEYAKNYNNENKQKIREYRKLYKIKNRKKISKRNSEYEKLYKEKRSKIRKERKRTDSVYKLKVNLRTRICMAFNLINIKKNSRTFEIIGLNPQVLKFYIENKFAKGMNWSNHGRWKNKSGKWIYGWDIDHIIPLSSAKNEEELIKLCHYTNLQPLWHRDNLIKADKVSAGLDNG